MRPLILSLVALVPPVGALADEARANYFDDPFLQVTAAIPNCPQQSLSVERLVRNIDDVESVINQLVVVSR